MTFPRADRPPGGNGGKQANIAGSRTRKVDIVWKSGRSGRKMPGFQTVSRGDGLRRAILSAFLVRRRQGTGRRRFIGTIVYTAEERRREIVRAVRRRGLRPGDSRRGIRGDAHGARSGAHRLAGKAGLPDPPTGPGGAGRRIGDPWCRGCVGGTRRAR